MQETQTVDDLSILDVTIRDGSYAIGYQYTPDRVFDIVRSLDEAGIDFAEVSHGCGLGAGRMPGLGAAASDLDYVRAAKKASKRIRIGVIAGSGATTKLSDIDEIIHEVDFIRFAANCDDPTFVESNIKHAHKQRGDLPIFFQLMRSSRLDAKAVIEAAKRVEQMGVNAIYIVDTAGHFSPDEIGELISKLRSQIKTAIGFHGHNNLDLAVANSLAAVKAGATFVDASLKGMGRGAGNAQMAPLVSLLKRMGLAKSVDLEEILYAAEEFISPIMPPRFGIDDIDIVTGDANIDLYPMDLYTRIAEEADTTLIDLIHELSKDKSIIEVNRDGIFRALKQLGANPEKVFQAIEAPTIEAPHTEKKQTPKKATKRNVLIALQTPVANLDFPQKYADDLADAFPKLNFRVVPFGTNIIDDIEDAEIAFTYTLSPEILTSAHKLKWFHSAITKPDVHDLDSFSKKNIRITSSGTAHFETTAESAIGMAYALARRIDLCAHLQDTHDFNTEAVLTSTPPLSELSGSNCLIIGMDVTGQAIASRCKQLGMKVIGIETEMKETHVDLDRVAQLDELDSLLAIADFVIICCPVTDKTRGLFNSHEFQMMKPTARIVNVARGGIIDELALAAALANETIGGAALDMFMTEPLPPAHPLFGAPNMIITPHISKSSTRFWERSVARFEENLRRYLDKQPLIEEIT